MRNKFKKIQNKIFDWRMKLKVYKGGGKNWRRKNGPNLKIKKKFKLNNEIKNQ
jgi:hypothetical protein